MSKILPSPCAIFSSTQSLEEAIHFLNQTDGSFLIIAGPSGSALGVFTKTNLLRAVSLAIKDNSLFKKPVSLFMSQPVKSLPLELIHTVPEFMHQNSMHHVPIHSKDPITDEDKIIGIVHSDSIFEEYVKNRHLFPLFTEKQPSQKRKIIGVLSVESATYQLTKSIFSQSRYIDVERLRFSQFNLARKADELDALILDIDETKNRQWFPIIKELAAHPGLEYVICTYSPELHEDVHPLFKNLSTSGILRVYEKPIQISEFTTALINYLQK